MYTANYQIFAEDDIFTYNTTIEHKWSMNRTAVRKPEQTNGC